MYSTYIVQLHAILPHLPTPEMDKQYQRHCDIRNKARRVLQLQNNIRAFKTIPKQYSPQSYLQLVQPTPTLTHEKYKELFFEHAITLEMEQARLRQIVSYTEEQLAKSTEPDATVATHYRHFITSNNIEEHEIRPDLLQHLPSPPETTQASVDATSQYILQQEHTTKPVKPRKRKQQNQRNADKLNPKTNKGPSEEPFLDMGQASIHQR